MILLDDKHLNKSNEFKNGILESGDSYCTSAINFHELISGCVNNPRIKN